MEITAQPLEASAFAPFGQVLEAEGGRIRQDRAATVFNGRDEAEPNLAVLCPKPGALPLHVRKLERHPLSSQTFIPLQVSRYLIAVCPQKPDGIPDVEALRAFIAREGQGINYNSGVWHHPLTVLDSPATLAMLFWQDGSATDTEWADVETDVVIVPP